MDRNDTLSLLKVADIQRTMQLGKTTIYRLVSRGEFPAPFKIGSGTYWRRADIERFLDARQPAEIEELIG